ncbi:hypothetical protein [Salinibacillus xinjiangensis]|uniref:Uncharacterized protein n=1 Tax=Salinibacillus xinjiangensis TaxID=1229268 RepID=A0A6G1X8D0_9BACI|nr:hypothetical protein [Salinibacillus xinjiangensis]MRG87189.1 hypothetical protein [Salinibacillus xinjiangensis]
MELVKRLKEKQENPNQRQTRFGVFSFACALLTLAYFNIFLITLEGIDIFSNLFLQAIPTIGVIAAVVSLFRVSYKRTFTWWALALYGFMIICILVIGFVEFVTYTKP